MKLENLARDKENRSMDTVTVLNSFSEMALEKSPFFSDLKSGGVQKEHLIDAFSQYYYWRNSLHKWFGTCVADAPAISDDNFQQVNQILTILCEHILEDFNHYGMLRDFLSRVGVDPDNVKPTTATIAYLRSFNERFSPASFEMAVAALAGRELLASYRSKIILSALLTTYKVQDVTFWNAHVEAEEEHFRAMWKPLMVLTKDEPKLLKAAQGEIDRHIQFWDDLYQEHDIAA